MIKLPAIEYMMKLINKHFGQENNPAFISDLNAEILRLNEPQMPEFPEWVNYCVKDDGNEWWLFNTKPIWNCADEFWDLGEDEIYARELTDTRAILWLEHINGNRPPSESIICLADYRKEKQK